MSLRTIQRALLSVSDKTGLVELGRSLVDLGVELISTGGTAKALKEANLSVRDVSEVTGFPEILDGRVKTLHPNVHGGLLAARDNTTHMQTTEQHGISLIDLVVCNLYPFEDTLAKDGSSHQEIIENIDVGGPTMIRAAAKNYSDVAVITSPDQYSLFLEELHSNNGALTLATRERLARVAFASTASYDASISSYFLGLEDGIQFPPRLNLSYQRKLELRYGENPHQPAAFYIEPNYPHPSIATAEKLHGKDLSYNNILDLDSAFNLAKEFTDPAAVVIKHNNPCGAAVGVTLEEAFQKAYEGDPLSAFGGVLAFNRELDEATARLITDPNRFIECVIAPGYADAAFELLTTRPSWKKNVRILRTSVLPPQPDSTPRMDYRRVDGGMLVQSRDVPANDFLTMTVPTNRQPTEQELRDLQFAWCVCKHVKSNAIVLVRDRMLVGVGAGQMSRVDSVHIAARKAGERVKGSVLASDAFFPFRDNVDKAAQEGVDAIVQPGGSMRDQDSIDACNEHNLAMVFTGVRHFRH
ncbi:MAG: bifunctional phosphoribosylaminoimidazolecarboxamide formyltransferase/IMP cyclohydrolase [Gemmataceae bacterium]